jgi:hypothetical protein
MRVAILYVFIILLKCGPLSAQTGSPVSYAIPKRVEVTAGSSFTLTATFKVPEPWYVYAPTGDNAAQGMIETRIIFVLPQGISRLGKPQLPESRFKNGHEVYQGADIRIGQQFSLAKDLKPGEYSIKAKVTYQTCNGDICLPPQTDEVAITVVVKRQIPVNSRGELR